MSVLSKVSLYFYQVFLGLPLKCSSRSGTDRNFEYSKEAFLWGLTVTLLQAMALSCNLYMYLLNTVKWNTMEVSVIILLISETVTDVVIFLNTAKKYRNLTDVCNILDRFDHNLLLAPTKYWMTIHFIFFIVILTAMPLLCDLTFVFLALGYGKDRIIITRQIITNIHPIVANCRQVCLMVQFHEVTYCIAKRFRLFNARIRQEVIIHSYRQSMRHHNLPHINHRQDTRSVANIKSFMSAYKMLRDATYKANAFYSDTLTSIIFCRFVYVTTCFFFLFLFIMWGSLLLLIVTVTWPLCSICYLLLIVSSSSYVTQAADETAPIICKLINRDLDPVLKRRLESFLLQLNTQNVVFSGRGFSQINRQILTKIATAVTTNLVDGLVWRCQACAQTRRKSMRFDSEITEGKLTQEDVMKKENLKNKNKMKNFNTSYEA
ncbi:hypothetical protein J6590_072675 [Homalodisca vitripennis]|nr:hypothetical protein J6590_072675 [Homalodisca vitripennis]